MNDTTNGGNILMEETQTKIRRYGALDSTDESDDDNDDVEKANNNNNNDQQQQQQPVVNITTRFAADRTYMAADRTTIAWVRTAISMIGFGVTIAKTADVLENEGLIKNPHGMQLFGVLFVGIAWLGLILIIIQNVRMEYRLSNSGYPREDCCLPLGLSMAILVLLIGILGAIVIYRPIQ